MCRCLGVCSIYYRNIPYVLTNRLSITLVPILIISIIPFLLFHSSVRVVHLRRGPTGLGFSIVGGKGSPNGDLPICVRTVSRDSVAGKEGLLQPGDIIMAVNGMSFDSCTHQGAVEMLKRCSDNIMLTVCTP